VSSHVLHEVESMAEQVILLYQGRVKAHGMRNEIRAVLSQYPHRVRIGTSDPRRLARALLVLDGIVAARIGETSVSIETQDPDGLFDALAALVIDDGVSVSDLWAEDVGLDAIFAYLTG
jgi:ABC-type multidrug transport system ATPase subunit